MMALTGSVLRKSPPSVRKIYLDMEVSSLTTDSLPDTRAIFTQELQESPLDQRHLIKRQEIQKTDKTHTTKDLMISSCMTLKSFNNHNKIKIHS
jgi:hypothetical protein